MTEQQKLSILNLTNAKQQEDNVQYLGIKICITNERMIQKNIDPNIKYISDKSQLWVPVKLSWFERITAVKMVLIPKLLFAFTNIVQDIPTTNLEQIQKILNNFIWD